MGWLWGLVPSVSKILILKMTFEIWTPGVLSLSLFTLSAFKRGNSLLKNASKRTRIAEMQGYTQKLAWDLFAYLRGIYLYICFQTWKFTFKETLQSGICLHICVGFICISAFKRGNSLLKERFKANQNCRNARVYSKISVGFVCIFAWYLFVYLLSNVEVHF